MSALLAELAGRLLSRWGANTNHREIILRYTAQDLNREGILLLETYSYSATVLLCFSASLLLRFKDIQLSRSRRGVLFRSQSCNFASLWMVLLKG